MKIDLDQRELEVLAEILRERIGDTSAQIHHAATSPYRDELRDRKRLLQTLLEKFDRREAA